MPLKKKAGEYNELNLVENTKKNTITTILSTHIPTEVGGPAQTLQLFQTPFIAVFLCYNFSSRRLETA